MRGSTTTDDNPLFSVRKLVISRQNQTKGWFGAILKIHNVDPILSTFSFKSKSGNKMANLWLMWCCKIVTATPVINSVLSHDLYTCYE